MSEPTRWPRPTALEWAILVVGLRRRWMGSTGLAVALTALAAVKLFLYDAFRVGAPFLVASSVSFGVALMLSSFIYRRHRGLAGD